MPRLFAAFALTFAFLVTAHADQRIGIGGGKKPEPVKFTGTVKHIDLEGGFFGIVSDDKKSYFPINLAKEFQKDGLRVAVEGLPRTDVFTTAQWGTPLEIKSIKKAEEKKKEEKVAASEPRTQ